MSIKKYPYPHQNFLTYKNLQVVGFLMDKVKQIFKLYGSK